MRKSTLDELHKLSAKALVRTEDMPEEQKKKEIADELYELLILAYVYGCDRTEQSLKESAPDVRLDDNLFEVSPEALYQAVYMRVAGENFEERLERHIREGTLTEEVLKNIFDTEYHRLEETGAYDTAGKVQEALTKGGASGKGKGKGTAGLQVYKGWRGMLDEKEREMHWWAEGQTVPLDQKFTMPDGAQALFPGMFGVPEHDCNCRCWVSYTIR